MEPRAQATPTRGIDRLPSGLYRVRVQRHGRQRTQVARTLREAENIRARLLTDLEAGASVDPRRGRVPASAFFETWLERGSHRDSTRRAYRALWRLHVAPTLGDTPLLAITAADVHDVLDSARAAELAPASVAAIRRLVVAVLNGAVDAELISRNPAARVPAPRVPDREHRTVTLAELERLADTIEPRFRALVLLGGLAGLRIGELAGLDVSHVDTMRRRLRVSQQADDAGRIGAPKSEASRRTIAIGPALAAEVAVHVERFVPSGEGPMFTMPRGGRLVASRFRRAYWHPAVARARLEPLRIHDLRHTAAALAIEAGAHPRALMQRLGHSSITTTLDVYGSLLPGLDERVAADVERKLARGVEDVGER